MKSERLGGDMAELRLHGIEITGAAYLCAICKAENKISKGKLLGEEFAHVGEQRV